MTTGTQTPQCASCHALLSKHHTSPCPNCGKESRETSVMTLHAIKSSESMQRHSMYYQKNPRPLAVVAVVTVLRPFLGFSFPAPLLAARVPRICSNAAVTRLKK